MTLGVGDITTFGNWILSPFNFLQNAASSALSTTPLTYDNGLTDTVLDDAYFYGGNWISTIFGKNIAPVLDANYSMSNVAKVVPGTPITDSSGNLVAPLTDLTSAINGGFQNAANFQGANPTIFGSTDSSFENSGGTPSASSTLLVWVAIGLGAFLLIKKG